MTFFLCCEVSLIITSNNTVRVIFSSPMRIWREYLCCKVLLLVYVCLIGTWANEWNSFVLNSLICLRHFGVSRPLTLVLLSYMEHFEPIVERFNSCYVRAALVPHGLVPANL